MLPLQNLTQGYNYEDASSHAQDDQSHILRVHVHSSNQGTPRVVNVLIAAESAAKHAISITALTAAAESSMHVVMANKHCRFLFHISPKFQPKLTAQRLKNGACSPPLSP